MKSKDPTDRLLGLAVVVGVLVSVLLAGAARSGDDVPSPRLSAAELFERTDYTWPYGAGPGYGEVPESDRWSPGIVRTAVGSFPLIEAATRFPAALRTEVKLAEFPRQYFVLTQLTSAGEPRIRTALDSIGRKGGAIMQPPPVNSWIVRLDAATHDELRHFTDVVQIEPYHPAFKLDPAIGTVPLRDAEKALSPVYDMQIFLFDGEDAVAVADRLEKLSAHVLSVDPRLIRAEVHRTRLHAIAGLEAGGWSTRTCGWKLRTGRARPRSKRVGGTTAPLSITRWVSMEAEGDSIELPRIDVLVGGERYRFTPDGERIVFDRLHLASDVVLIELVR